MKFWSTFLMNDWSHGMRRRFWSLLTVRAAALTPAQWAVKAFVSNSLHLILTAQALTRCMDPPGHKHTSTPSLTHINTHRFHIKASCNPSAARCVLPVALLTLHDEFIVHVLFLTQRTASKAATWSTTTVVILPITAHPRRGGATLDALHTPEDRTDTHSEENPGTWMHSWLRKTTLPLALPGSFRDRVKRWVQTVGVVTDVTVIT